MTLLGAKSSTKLESANPASCVSCPQPFLPPPIPHTMFAQRIFRPANALSQVRRPRRPLQLNCTANKCTAGPPICIDGCAQERRQQRPALHGSRPRCRVWWLLLHAPERWRCAALRRGQQDPRVDRTARKGCLHGRRAGLPVAEARQVGDHQPQHQEAHLLAARA
jgi:hypothetical protein